VTDYRSDDDRAIRDLVARYALALDTDDIDRCLELFTDDGQFVVFGREFSGRDQIRELSRDGKQWRFRRRRCRFITSGGLADRPEVPSS
jgi:uncharacterized protein (TIGR02246 family)